MLINRYLFFSIFTIVSVSEQKTSPPDNKNDSYSTIAAALVGTLTTIVVLGSCVLFVSCWKIKNGKRDQEQSLENCQDQEEKVTGPLDTPSNLVTNSPDIVRHQTGKLTYILFKFHMCNSILYLCNTMNEILLGREHIVDIFIHSNRLNYFEES